jgi:hypothetical protein
VLKSAELDVLRWVTRPAQEAKLPISRSDSYPRRLDGIMWINSISRVGFRSGEPERQVSVRDTGDERL